LLFITVLGSCDTNFKTCDTYYKKGKNPMRKISSSIFQITNMHPVKITIERWADENSPPLESFVNEIKKKAKTDKPIDDYLGDPNNSKWIVEKAIEYFNEPNNWIVEREITDKTWTKIIMWALAEPQKGGLENFGMDWIERICFKDDRGKIKWTPFLIIPCDKEVYVGDGHYYETTTCNVFIKILNIECDCRCQRQLLKRLPFLESNQPSQKPSE